MEEELLANLTDFFKYGKDFLYNFNSVYPIKVNNKVLSDAKSLTEEFGKYFQSVYQPNIIPINYLNTNKYCTNDNILIPVITKGETLRARSAAGIVTFLLLFSNLLLNLFLQFFCSYII